MGQSISKIIIILSFRISISKNKNIDHGVKQSCAIISTQVTYELNHISVLGHSTISSALNFCFYVFYCDLKEKYIRRNTNCTKKKSLYVKSVFLFCQNLGLVRPVQEKIKLPLPKIDKVGSLI